MRYYWLQMLQFKSKLKRVRVVNSARALHYLDTKHRKRWYSQELRSSPFGFSQIELIVAITVVVLLMIVIIASLGSVRERSKIASCSANLRTIGTAIRLYANEHGGNLPGFDLNQSGQILENVTSWGFNNAIPRKLMNSGYIDTKDVFFCPADRFRAAARENGSGWSRNVEHGGGAYIASGYWHIYIRPGSRSSESIFEPRYSLLNDPRVIIAFDQFEFAGYAPFHASGGINVLRLGGSVDWIDSNRLDTSRGIYALMDLE